MLVQARFTHAFRSTLAGLACTFVALGACGGENDADPGTSADAGTSRPDAGPARDATTPPFDSSAPQDSTTSSDDASPRPDASSDEGSDAKGGGGTIDASTSIDARLPSDAAGDASSALEAAAPDTSTPVDAAVADKWPLQASTTCAPQSNACAERPAVAGVFAAYRKDAYLPESEYSEQGVVPLDGGRFQIAGTASVAGEVTRVRINGTSVDDLLSQKAIDWYHVWPRVAVAGQPIWVAFHSRRSDWDRASNGTVSVETSAGPAMSGTFAVAKPPVPLRYVTTADNGATLLVHAVNTDSAPRTIARVIVDGRDATASTCIASPTLAPGEHALLRIPLCTPKRAGDPWTVSLELREGAPSVGVGRVVPEFFPIESWVRRDECPLPGGNDANLAKHQAAGIDTHYMYFGNAGCGLSGKDVVNTRLATLGGKLKVLIGDDFLNTSNPETAITNTAHVAGFLTGDESDKEYETNNFPTPEIKARISRRLWSMYPSLPTYNGGMTNKKVGAFAGMADIQGMDFYVAGCAPHVTTAGSRMPIRGAYDYLKNARMNHAPLPTWLYAQGLHDGWNKKVFGNVVHVQPNAAEIRYQALSVAAAGGKGLMWFQSDLDESKLAPASWDAMAGSGKALRAVRSWLREGDPAGLGSAQVSGGGSPSPIVETIRARDAIVVAVLSQHTTAEPNDVSCAAIYALQPIPRFAFGSQSTDVRVRIPNDFTAADLFEVTMDKSPALTTVTAPTVIGREVRFPVTLNSDAPVRLFVIARDGSARAAAASALAAIP